MYLSSDQIEELILENQYDFSGNKFQSRCFSGHFENNVSLPALALPGGDIGEILILLSASHTYGFDCDLLKSIKIIKEVSAAAKSQEYQHFNQFAAEECRYLHLLSESPEIFSLKSEMVNSVFRTLEQSELIKNEEKIHKEVYRESACIIIEGNKGVLPHYLFQSAQGTIDARIFIYHKSLIDERRKLIAKNLFQSKAINLLEGQDEEYIYEVLSEVGDSHLFEVLHRIDSNLPIYSATLTPIIKIELYS